MKPPLAFGIKTLSIIAAAVALAFLFNAMRTDDPFAVRSTTSTPQQDTPVPDKEISLAEAEALFRSGQAVFLDARDPDLYAAGHIEGAFSLPPFAFTREFPAIREQLEQKTAITYCDGEFCELSHELADQLSAAGADNVRVLKNGWTLWQTQGLPTASGTAPRPDTAPDTATDTAPSNQSDTAIPDEPGTTNGGADSETADEAEPASTTPDHDAVPNIDGAGSNTPADPESTAPDHDADANASEAS